MHDLLDAGPVDKITGLSQKQMMIREERDGTVYVQNLKAE